MPVPLWSAAAAPWGDEPRLLCAPREFLLEPLALADLLGQQFLDFLQFLGGLGHVAGNRGVPVDGLAHVAALLRRRELALEDGAAQVEFGADQFQFFADLL